MSVVDCANCGSAVPARSRFCPECGRPLEDARIVSGDDPPTRRVWPPEWGLAAVVILAAAGIVLLGAQVWIWGIVLLLAAGAIFLVQRETERRAGRAVLGNVRTRLAAHRELVSARSRGQIDLFRLRRELAELQAEQSRGYHELGRAGYVRDRDAVQAAREHLDDVNERLAAKEAEVQVLLGEMQERVRRVQAQAAPTQALSAQEPPLVPEPYPPPDEGTPPEPPRLPEPTPDPVPEPSPEPVPEPFPGEPAPEPERGPPPQTRRRRASKARKS
ncbi:MAG TPA: zinc-ribbon domain-containing protein [Gaiellaceae bacterium]|nr:zinc-ribbon domain-containing protein [Gaiellaceae bacterium]